MQKVNYNDLNESMALYLLTHQFLKASSHFKISKIGNGKITNSPRSLKTMTMPRVKEIVESFLRNKHGQFVCLSSLDISDARIWKDLVRMLDSHFRDVLTLDIDDKFGATE